MAGLFDTIIMKWIIEESGWTLTTGTVPLGFLAAFGLIE
jgi:hypothetical protein